MGVIIDGKALGSPPPEPLEGDLYIYADVACTQPLAEVTEVDFGTFPYTDCGHVAASKSKTVWCKNESNYPMMLMISVDNPIIYLIPPGKLLIGSVIAIGDVLEVGLAVAIKVATDGSMVKFKISIRGNPMGAPK